MTRPVSRPPARRGGERSVLTVSALVRLVRGQLEGEFQDLWVEGEVSDLSRPASGHVYFVLKDAQASLRAVMWRSDCVRLRFRPEQGARVRARGTLTIYEQRGAFQMRVTHLEEAGRGDLHQRFEQVRARLEAAGLLDEERKRPLPPWPRHLGVVTSRNGAALRDVLKVLGQAVPVRVTLCHSSVQGEGAPAEIEAALERLASMADRPDLVIVARGGGSADELSAWNDERVALAICRHPVPVVSGVGHQVDLTIADLVADRRAATPTEAAALAVPELGAAARLLRDLLRGLGRGARLDLRERRSRLASLRAELPAGERLLDSPRQRLDELARQARRAARARLEGSERRRAALEARLGRLHPAARLERRRGVLARARGRLEARLAGELAARRGRLGRAASALECLSPLGVLGRGYALARGPDGAVLREASAVAPGDLVEVRLERGSLGCEVREVRPAREPGGASG